MAEHRSIFQYLGKCYSLDSSSVYARNILSAKTECRIFVGAKETLLSGANAIVRIEREAGTAAAKLSYIYQHEKQMVYTPFWVSGRLGGDEVICAPLVWFHAQVDFDSKLCFLKVNREAFRINQGLLRLLVGHSDDLDDFYQALLAVFNSPGLDEGSIRSIKVALSKYAVSVNHEEFHSFSMGKSVKVLRREVKKSSALKLSLAPIAWLQKKSDEKRGVLTELRSLEEVECLSPPLKRLLSNEKSADFAARTQEDSSKTKFNLPMVPAVLSHSQEAILRSIMFLEANPY